MRPSSDYIDHLRPIASGNIRLKDSLLVFAARTHCDYCCRDVAVCVSVTLMYCAQTTESIIMRTSPDCSPAILVFSY